MKTLYLTRGNNILVDKENDTTGRLDTCRQAIDYIYLVEEPMHVIYQYGETRSEVDAEAGDLIITFYDKVFKNQMIVVKHEQWAENIREYIKHEQEEKLRWAESKNQCDACPKCESAA